MKNGRKRTRSRTRTFRVWTHAEADSARPYLTSVLHSLREHTLQARNQDLRASRLRQRPGRPDRATLIAQEETAREADRARAQLENDLKELWNLNIYCIDPVRGLALIPFAHPDKQLAWFVFELFEKEQLRSWRYHGDPLETRRPLAEALAASPAPPLIV